jgi:hypothetical protein
MAKLQGNSQLVDTAGKPLNSLLDINRREPDEKYSIYGRLLPSRLWSLLGLTADELYRAESGRRITIIAPDSLALVRIEVRANPAAADTVFFLELSDTGFNQMELCFCIIRDPSAPRYNVDMDDQGRVNCFATQGRNIPEELRAMRAGLFPHQTRTGLRLFSEFLPLLEHFTDALGMEMIVAELLTYCNAIRYENYGFDYLSGLRLMQEIDHQFQPGGSYFKRLDGSSEFRLRGMERTARGRSWVIHDGIMDEPWDNVRIYKMIGIRAGVNTFPGREQDFRCTL